MTTTQSTTTGVPHLVLLSRGSVVQVLHPSATSLPMQLWVFLARQWRTNRLCAIRSLLGCRSTLLPRLLPSLTSTGITLSHLLMIPFWCWTQLCSTIPVASFRFPTGYCRIFRIKLWSSSQISHPWSTIQIFSSTLLLRRLRLWWVQIALRRWWCVVEDFIWIPRIFSVRRFVGMGFSFSCLVTMETWWTGMVATWTAQLSNTMSALTALPLLPASAATQDQSE